MKTTSGNATINNFFEYTSYINNNKNLFKNQSYYQYEKIIEQLLELLLELNNVIYKDLCKSLPGKELFDYIINTTTDNLEGKYNYVYLNKMTILTYITFFKKRVRSMIYLLDSPDDFIKKINNQENFDTYVNKLKNFLTQIDILLPTLTNNNNNTNRNNNNTNRNNIKTYNNNKTYHKSTHDDISKNNTEYVFIYDSTYKCFYEKNNRGITLADPNMFFAFGEHQQNFLSKLDK